MNIFYIKLNLNGHTKGFTLVEMIVVLGVFSYLMTLAAGILYMTQDINVKLQGSQAVLDNVNLSMETISRDIRQGYSFHCAETLDEIDMNLRKSCSYENVGAGHGGKVLFFRPASAATSTDRVAYYASTTQYGDVILKDEYISGSTTTYQMTANDVKIKSLIFYVVGANSGGEIGQDVDDVHDFAQPLITINLTGETILIGKNGTTTPVSFSIQSSVTARSFDK
ncbi:type II secretion system GspH family protein [Candidatus Gracilibacteria bacterium]|nr:type II secretion system GspH family protein [Candidatus Gracilibacteria bacterium]MCF7898988.1 type II secretion system GspH family protein [Candidatus Paceibacterota bacterium]